MSGDNRDRNKNCKNSCGAEWAYSDNVRQVFGKQQGAALFDGEVLHGRVGTFGITIDKHFIVSLGAEYRECHTKGNWTRL